MAWHQTAHQQHTHTPTHTPIENSIKQQNTHPHTHTSIEYLHQPATHLHTHTHNYQVTPSNRAPATHTHTHTYRHRIMHQLCLPTPHTHTYQVTPSSQSALPRPPHLCQAYSRGNAPIIAPPSLSQNSTHHYYNDIAAQQSALATCMSSIPPICASSHMIRSCRGYLFTIRNFAEYRLFCRALLQKRPIISVCVCSSQYAIRAAMSAAMSEYYIIIFPAICMLRRHVCRRPHPAAHHDVLSEYVHDITCIRSVLSQCAIWKNMRYGVASVSRID